MEVGHAVGVAAGHLTAPRALDLVGRRTRAEAQQVGGLCGAGGRGERGRLLLLEQAGALVSPGIGLILTVVAGIAWFALSLTAIFRR